ncbi:LysR family transcriptional regulator [Aeromicrobium sp. CF4.19]|uniref:LysR family transcriptional regulator n=1 Tax=Aeromicrobium sp. CF4.19 TaxID=3373082 RepID=UPI003EE7D693
MRVERARYFLAAVETGSLRAAAARCTVSQPALGEQVAMLEEELDVVLLTRSRTGVRPTPAGVAMLEPLTRLVEAEDDARRAAVAAGGVTQGRVEIGAVSAVVETVVAPVVARMHAEHPGLHFGITEGSTTEVEQRVASGDLDLGIVTVPTTAAAPSLRRRVLVSLPVGVVARPDHPLADRTELTWGDIAPWPVVTMRRGTVLWDRLHDHVDGPSIVVQAMSARSMRVLVSRGAGIGILASTHSPTDELGLRWIPLAGAAPVELCLVQRSDSQPSAAALVVRRLLTTQTATLVGGA